MTSMMKPSTPRFETCLFGPSGMPIPIQGYQPSSTTVVEATGQEYLSEENCTTNEDGSKESTEENQELNVVNSDEVGDLETKVKQQLDLKEQIYTHIKQNNDTVQDQSQAIENNKLGDNESSTSSNEGRENINNCIEAHTVGVDEINQNEDTSKSNNEHISINEDAIVEAISSMSPSPSSSLETTCNTTAAATTTTRTPPQSPKNSTIPPRPAKPSSTKSIKKPSNISSSTPSININEPNNESKDKNSNASVKGHTINLQELRRLSSQGVPSDCSYRPLAWRILLGYLPLDTTKWQSVLNRDRLLYRTLVKDLFIFGEGHDYPFESEGRKLVGKGLEIEGKKGNIKDYDRVNSWRRDHNNDTSIENNGRESIIVNKNQENTESKDEGVEVKRTLTIDSSSDEEFTKEIDNNKTSFDSSSDEIPLSVRELWRKSGRDPDCLMAGMGKTFSGRYVNALFVTNNETASTQTNDVDRSFTLSTSLDGDFEPKWKHFLENASLLDEIRKDVVRTHPDLQFFLETEDNLGSRRYAAIERILFVWAKLNKGVSIFGLIFSILR